MKRKTLREYKKYPLVNLVKVMSLKSFKSRSKTVLYIHDYEQSAFVNISKTFVQAYLTARKDTNVIVLDWSNLSKKGFITNAASNTDMVHHIIFTIAKFLYIHFENINVPYLGRSSSWNLFIRFDRGWTSEKILACCWIFSWLSHSRRYWKENKNPWCHFK